MMNKTTLLLLLAMMIGCASKPVIPTEKKVKKVIPTTKKTVAEIEEEKDSEETADDAETETATIYLKKTEQQFKNGTFIHEIIKGEEIMGEWWPVNAIDLVTKESHPDLFAKGDLETIINDFGGIAVAPDGMTSGASPGKLEGKALIDGVLYDGDHTDPQYGIVLLEENGTKITFTHKDEVLEAFDDMDAFFAEYEGNENATIFYTPSIKRGDKELNNDTMIHRALVRRVNADDEQEVAMAILKKPIKNKEMIALMNGLNTKDDEGKILTQTTHIYYTDGGNNYGQAARLDADAKVTLVGERNPDLVTNYLVLY
ncbi:MAG TPA: hypothetical protein PKC21_00135 [Oligoflexia bacterium]|nr:hypothetical protein [Oligoflexia bacterium]HMR23734.1 hypothetical protein [Oligoflexia bacterium]